MTDENVEASPVEIALRPAGDVARFGLVALSTDLTTEGDMALLLPPGAALHVSRVAFENPTTPANLARMAPRLTGAADLLVPGAALRAIYYACTAASVAMGDDYVREAVQAARPGVPVVTPTGAASAGFKALGVGRVALLTPYLPETTAPMAAYFSAQGLDVRRTHCMGLADDRDIARVAPEAILAAAQAVDCPEAEALFISCTALPAAALVPRIEAAIGKPVLTSNQAGAWALARAGGFGGHRPAAGGRLFQAAPAESAAR
ncbi:ectoine utilization protein EutA [Maritimibacter sp. 55A14]|uniref:aspartate racemase/maleate isomerase family protein n=1 Tax=Maritimibacter sp. 55A14 TaxID=2174844 RepID=UPI000D61AD7D|nr:aspartate/glutamate racemase family protein [Maritimibacter sp. 55A14]PWE33766.1 ectoine utilization protein EutA [Maritimibacter sp. 55A14]